MLDAILPNFRIWTHLRDITILFSARLRRTFSLQTCLCHSSRCVSGIAFCQGRFSGLQGCCSIWGAQAVIPLVAYSKLSVPFWVQRAPLDRKSTRLNSSHLGISYAVFCL